VIGNILRNNFSVNTRAQARANTGGADGEIELFEMCRLSMAWFTHLKLRYVLAKTLDDSSEEHAETSRTEVNFRSHRESCYNI